MQQNYNEKSIQHQFDAYCKKVLRNELNLFENETLEKKKMRNYWTSQMKLNTLTHFAKQDIYFLFGMEILISNKKLSIAKPVIGHKKFFILQV